MRNWVKIIVLGLVVGFLPACGIFLESDISADEVEVLSPGDSVFSTTVFFSWEENEEALEYRVVIATPSFDSLQQVVLDTLVTSTSLAYELSPDEYEWKVRPENAGYDGLYVQNRFVVERDPDITNEEVTLLYPPDGHKDNNTTITLSWDNILQADNYLVQVWYLDGNGSDKISVDPTGGQGTSETFLQLTLDEPIRTYFWKVKAVNEVSSTDFSLQYEFKIDTTNVSN